MKWDTDDTDSLRENADEHSFFLFCQDDLSRSPQQ